MTSAQYLERRSELEVYFDRTALDAWASRVEEIVSGGRTTPKLVPLSARTA